MPSEGPTRIPFLDGVRGYASLWVMLGHFSTRTGFGIPIVENPGIAVDVFMIVSGFLMTQHFFLREKVEPWQSGRTWIIFYARRFFRIAPLYYVLLIPSFFAFDYLSNAQQLTLKSLLNIDYRPSASADVANVLAHLSFLFGLFPKYCSVLIIPDWSLSLEMQFYAVFPFLMLLARQLNIFRVTILILPVWFFSRAFRLAAGQWGPFGQMLSLQSFLPMKIGLFLIGMILAWAWIDGKGKFTGKTTILLLLMGFVAACARDKNDTPVDGSIIIVISLILALLLFYDEGLISLGIDRWVSMIGQFLSNRLSRFLADVSYAVYLLHLLVMLPLLKMLCGFPWFVQERGGVRFLILTLIAGPITYGLAWILFLTLETRGIQLGKLCIDRVFASRMLLVSEPLAMKRRGGTNTSL